MARSKNKLKERTKVTIPVAQAIQRTKNWRNFITSFLKFSNPNKLPKAVYISKADIEDLAVACKTDETIAGVRAYFTLKNDHMKVPYDNEVKFVLVLVKVRDDLNYGEDLLFVNEIQGVRSPINEAFEMNDMEPVFEESSVYDFTMPCPDCCDPSSELFGDQP